MKRSKINGSLAQPSSSHQEILFDGQGIQGDEHINDASRTRMLENLKIALLFSRRQFQIEKDKQD